MGKDLEPLPAWKQWWHRTGNQRRKALTAFAILARRLVTLAISLVGAILIFIGVYSVYPPVAWVTGGLLLWALQWNYGKEEGQE